MLIKTSKYILNNEKKSISNNFSMPNVGPNIEQHGPPSTPNYRSYPQDLQD